MIRIARWSLLAALATAATAATSCATPRPHYVFVMPVPSAAPRPDPGDPTTPKVAVLGQVTQPGLVRFRAGLTVLGAIVDSGGFTALAWRWQVTVSRTVEGGRRHLYAVPVPAIVDGDRPDFELRAGDIVFVPERDI